MKYLGFIPVSPDGAPFRYQAGADEVVNERHGTLSNPRLHSTIDPASPLADLLEQFQSLRADLRFREDGVHTVVTFSRK